MIADTADGRHFVILAIGGVLAWTIVLIQSIWSDDALCVAIAASESRPATAHISSLGFLPSVRMIAIAAHRSDIATLSRKLNKYRLCCVDISTEPTDSPCTNGWSRKNTQKTRQIRCNADRRLIIISAVSFTVAYENCAKRENKVDRRQISAQSPRMSRMKMKNEMKNTVAHTHTHDKYECNANEFGRHNVISLASLAIVIGVVIDGNMGQKLWLIQMCEHDIE